MGQIINGILITASVITAIATIIGVPIAAYRIQKKLKEKAISKAEKEKAAKEREDRQDKDINQMKEEFCLVMYGLSACLDGLLQQGCNHSVPDAKEKIDKYLNQRAHK